MAQLTGNPIKDSYLGLIKTTDNAALSGTAKAITDGSGGATNIQMSNTSTNFVSGTVDFTGSTVSGLPSSGGGIVYFGTGKVVNTAYLQQDIVQAVFTIPANTFSAGDYFMIRSFENRDGLNATQYSSIWLTEDVQTVGQQASNPSNASFSFSQIQTSQQGTGVMQRHCFVSATTETNWLEESSGANDDAENLFGGSVNANSIDWTVNQYVYLQMYSDSTSGTYTNYGMHLTKLN